MRQMKGVGLPQSLAPSYFTVSLEYREAMSSQEERVYVDEQRPNEEFREKSENMRRVCPDFRNSKESLYHR